MLQDAQDQSDDGADSDASGTAASGTALGDANDLEMEGSEPDLEAASRHVGELDARLCELERR